MECRGTIRTIYGGFPDSEALAWTKDDTQWHSDWKHVFSVLSFLCMRSTGWASIPPLNGLMRFLCKQGTLYKPGGSKFKCIVIVIEDSKRHGIMLDIPQSIVAVQLDYRGRFATSSQGFPLLDSMLASRGAADHLLLDVLG